MRTETWNRTPIPERVARRAIERVDIDENGCWISRYSVTARGYAQIGWSKGDERHMVLAHRAAWVAANGQVPVGMTLDHTCKVKRCVNPDHLRLMSNFENARRGNADWSLDLACRRGHTAQRVVVSDPRKASGASTACPECRKLWSLRRNWIRYHPGEPMPQRLAL